MGACFSCKPKPALQNVRVVHLNGYVEDYEHPISVGQVTGKPAKHFVCTPAQLLSTGSKPLKQDTLLQPGQVYFLLPYSALQSDVSPLDWASISRKLTAAAAKSRRSSCEANNNSSHSSPLAPSSPLMMGQFCSSPVWSSSSSPGRSPSRFSMEQENMGSLMDYGSQRSCRARSWKPLLDTITEKSFNRRTESDLQEMHVEAVK
ncbi:hypothetical protein PRUPE_1G076900 [Prunus persica]|uniref:DUF4228 domain protein n=3 Tax=Prunus TaxID=3754 RepID=A0A5E4FME8_PRUDU|nr:uncharacterized protein LOC18778215 [Prunus persica]KAI5348550.1 hypothetical protein L3X38_001437 [Prunus dulcis]ONI27266.1 hypothetical protein PRUPE_1G076900 [Prunus persica]VVA28281.1 PREDICTED: Protein of unknown function DUF4228 [Prunus dulcis]